MGNQMCANDKYINVDIQKTNINQYRGRTHIHEMIYYTDKVIRFGDLIIQKKPGTNLNEFILQLYNGEKQQILQIQQRAFPSNSIVQGTRKKTIHFQGILQDQQRPECRLFYGNQGLIKFTYLVKPFNRYEQYNFKQILYDLYMQRTISQQLKKNNYLHNHVESYIVQSGEERSYHDKCLVIIKEQVAASLVQIIQYRKQSNWAWTQQQFQILIYDTLTALQVLHNANISHNDIRPSNIFYSVHKNCYMLSGFTFAKKHVNKVAYNQQINGIPFFLSPEVRNIILSGNHQVGYNQFQNDIYALGISLLTAFFLNTPTNPQILINLIKQYQSTYKNSLQILSKMLKKHSERASVSTLLVELVSLCPNLKYSNVDRSEQQFDIEDLQLVMQTTKTRQTTLITSLRYKNSPKQGDDLNEKRSFAQAYQFIFAYQKALKQYKQIYQYYQLNHNKVQLAILSEKIADLSRDQTGHYHQKASSFYQQIANDALEQHKIDQSVHYYNKAIECLQKSNGVDTPFQQARILRSLAKAHGQKFQYQIARTFLQQALDITGKSKSENSLEYAQVLAQLAKNQLKFLQFKTVQGLIKKSFKIIQSTQFASNPKSFIVKMTVLQTLGQSFRLKAKNHQKRDIYRQKSQKCLLQALTLTEQTKQTYEKAAQVHAQLGHLYFQEGSLHDVIQARKQYERSLLIFRKKNVSSIQIGLGLTFIGNCFKVSKQYDKAIKKYNEAIQIFRKELGNDHNQYIAITIGNLGVALRENGQREAGQQYILVAKKILNVVEGQKSANYRYFSGM